MSPKYRDTRTERLANRQNVPAFSGFAKQALRLARWLDTSPQMWLNLQAIHDLHKAEAEAGDAIREQVTPLRHAG